MPSKRGGIVKTAKKAKKSVTQKMAAKSTTPAEVNPPEDLSKRPVYFWRQYNHEYGFLSQWYRSPFSDPKEPEIVYKTAEQYMMYQKAILFQDPERAAQILQTHDPREQKRLGRLVQGFDEKIWLENRMGIVEEASYLKFKYGKRDVDEKEKKEEEQKNESLREMLMRTGERKLVEASPMDKIWGIGFGEKNADGKRDKWGLNLLGICLMRARKRLEMETEEEPSPTEDKPSEPESGVA